MPNCGHKLTTRINSNGGVGLFKGIFYFIGLRVLQNDDFISSYQIGTNQKILISNISGNVDAKTNYNGKSIENHLSYNFIDSGKKVLKHNDIFDSLVLKYRVKLVRIQER